MVRKLTHTFLGIPTKLCIFIGILLLAAGITYRHLSWKRTSMHTPIARNVIPINVLDEEAFLDAHIPHSLNIPFDVFESFIPHLNKYKTYVLYCSNYLCTASHAAAEMLKKHGFPHVFVYNGGMSDWYQHAKESPLYKVEGPAEAEYLQIIVPAPRSQQVNIDSQTPAYELITAETLQKMLYEDKKISE